MSISGKAVLPRAGKGSVASASSAVLARKPGALRNGTPFKDWLLPGALGRVRHKLAAVADGNRQMVDILATVLSDGLAAVEAACAEALRQGVYSADITLNIIARQRQPPAGMSILTPDALRLRYQPIADCARYDSLRRAADGTFKDSRQHGRVEAV